MSTYIKETHLKNVQSIVVLCGLECEKLSKEAKLVKEVSNQRNRHQLKKEKKKGARRTDEETCSGLRGVVP